MTTSEQLVINLLVNADGKVYSTAHQYGVYKHEFLSLQNCFSGPNGICNVTGKSEN